MELEFDFKKCGRSIDEVGHREQNAALKVLMGYLTKEVLSVKGEDLLFLFMQGSTLLGFRG